jgi:hypothetical protein
LLPFANVSTISHELCANRDVTHTGVFVSGRNNRWAAHDKPSIAQIFPVFWRQHGATFKYPNVAMWTRSVVEGYQYNNSKHKDDEHEASHWWFLSRSA